MIADTFFTRRAALKALTLWALVLTSRFAAGQAKHEDPPIKAAGDTADASERKVGKETAKKGKNISLTVLVTGEGKPIALAEVKIVKAPKGIGEKLARTNDAGEVIFDFAATGEATVRVLVAGWMSTLKDVDLKEGVQRLTIALSPL